jgi:hypothetical protein
VSGGRGLKVHRLKEGRLTVAVRYRTVCPGHVWYNSCTEDQVLREFRKVRQDPGTYRRLFTDEYFDLYLWYRWRWGRLRGFQLVYDKDGSCHALTWTRRGGYRHESVDDGEGGGGGGYKPSPILVPDGSVDCIALADRFLQASSYLSRRLRALMHRVILQYGHIEDRR